MTVIMSGLRFVFSWGGLYGFGEYLCGYRILLVLPRFLCRSCRRTESGVRMFCFCDSFAGFARVPRLIACLLRAPGGCFCFVDPAALSSSPLRFIHIGRPGSFAAEFPLQCTHTRLLTVFCRSMFGTEAVYVPASTVCRACDFATVGASDDPLRFDIVPGVAVVCF